MLKEMSKTAVPFPSVTALIFLSLTVMVRFAPSIASPI